MLFGSLVFLLGLSSVQVNDIEGSFIKGDYEDAKRLALDFLANNPKDVNSDQVQYYLAVSDIYLKQYPEAISILKKITQAQTALGSLKDKASLALIDCYYLSEQYSQAEKEAGELLKKNRKTDYLSLIYFKLAKAELKLTKWKDARDHLEKIIAEFPDSLEVKFARQLLEEKQYFAVQVGSFVDQSRAETLMNELKEKKEYSYIVESVDEQNRKLYRVRVGQLALLNQAKELKIKLAGQGYPAQIFP